MTISQTPAPARSDLRPTGGTTTPDHPFRWHGRMLSVGALMWAGVMVFTGTAPEITGIEAVAFGIGSGAFQIGLLCLLRVLWRTRALGDGRLSRFFLRAETVALSLAICSTFVDAIQVSDLDEPMWLALDLFWPLSMLGMFLIGVRIAIAGRWKGLSRFWPMVAESWAVVCVPTIAIFGQAAANVVAPLHLLVGYTVLGVIVSRKEK